MLNCSTGKQVYFTSILVASFSRLFKAKSGNAVLDPCPEPPLPPHLDTGLKSGPLNRIKHTYDMQIENKAYITNWKKLSIQSKA